MQSRHHAALPGSPYDAASFPTMLLWDRQECIPLSDVLGDRDIILLLTPVVVPYDNDPENTTDPFEPLGRAIAARHPHVHHVPYTKANGLTNWHRDFMARARAVVFVISGVPNPGDPSQVDFAKLARVLGKEQPQVIVACCSVQALQLEDEVFPTIVQVAGYSPTALEAAAAIIFGESRPGSSREVNVQNLILAPRTWVVEDWNPNKDLQMIHQLWIECLPKQFHLSHYVLGSLLRREGWAEHYVVREPENGDLVGFCATYTTYADSDVERLIGSLAVILVRQSYRQRGIGRSLHDFALRKLSRIRGVGQLQLGSTFPRLLYGPPSILPSRAWFGRRGWQVDQRGAEVSDWLLNFDDMPKNSFSSAGLTFRRCDMMEFQQVLEMVDRDSVRKNNMGWYEEYAKLANTIHVEDIILGLEGNNIVATALTYIPNSGNPVADDLPWARTIGTDVGGVTCICIADDNPDMINSRDSVMIRLLDTCIKLLAEQGMRQLFIDGVRGGDEGFQSIGFQKWAQYSDVWRKAGSSS